MKSFPRRGEVWLVNWNPARGSEQAGRRPALVIQNDIGNEKASTTKIFPMNVKVDAPEGGLGLASIVKTSQILTVDKKRLERRLGQLSSEKMKEVNLAIKLSLDLT